MPDTNNQIVKPVVFLAFANDRDDTVGYLRNLPAEARRLSDVLRSAEQAGLCEVVVRQNCTATDIFKVFQDPEYRNRVAIFHYAGHANGYQLLLETEHGPAALADAGGMAAFLSQQQALELVFLNGCSTEQQSEGLLQANISVVIATSQAIDDQVATDFAFQFYQGLASGASIKTSFEEAASAVQTTNGKDTRALFFGNEKDLLGPRDTERRPWILRLRPGSESIAYWNLPLAVNDPLFGLPLLPKQDLPESPYRHLSQFTRRDAEVFFGRGHQIRQLYDRLTAPDTPPILLFYGQSGVGKSSLLDAGLIPRLEQDFAVLYLRRSASGLLATLRQAFLKEGSKESLSSAWLANEKQLGKPLIVFLDQVEELYTRPTTDDELEQLLETVKATFSETEHRPLGKLVLGFRKEWLAELEASMAAFELPRTKFFLEPLDRTGIIEIVRGPARAERLRERYGLTVEDGLSEIIADDLLEDRDSAIAPTLQILLTKMWSKATEANYEKPYFCKEHYYQLKHDGILLRDFLTQQMTVFGERYPDVVNSGLLLDIVALHTTPLGTANECSLEQLQQQYAHLGATLPSILQQCQDLYLLTIASGSLKDGPKTTRLAHDTLAPLVRERYDVSDRPGQRARRILNNRSVDWGGNLVGTPLDEADLSIVEKGVRATRALSPTEQRLLEASRDLRKRLKRVRTLGQLAATAALFFVISFAGIAVWKWREALRAEAMEKEARIDAQKQAGIANAQSVIAQGNLKTARHSVNVLLKLYMELPQRAGEIAVATNSAEAREAFSHLERDGLPTSLRVTSPKIATALQQIDECIKAWQESSSEMNGESAQQCKQAILELVKQTKMAWESRSSDGPTAMTRVAQIAQQSKLEREIIWTSLCTRARTVTREIADAPDKDSMLEFRPEFERLYWAELYWLELDEPRLRSESNSDRETLQEAMVNFRRDGLKNWSLDMVSKAELDKYADAVGSRCDEITGLLTEDRGGSVFSK